MAVFESGEMYLKAIYVLAQSGQAVRRIDVSEYLGYSKPSVTRAIGLLEKDGLVSTGAEGALCLTDAGHQAAERIYERHEILTDLFTKLGVSRKTADEDACRIEHCISDETFDAIKRHIREFGSKA